MKKRLYIKPETKLEIAFVECVLMENSGETDKPMSKSRDDFSEDDVENLDESKPTEYSLW